jgi:capsular polysaccharide biosynthesis protein
MELQDYAAALRRYWPTWTGLTLVGVLAALAVVLFSTPAYQATATVFVASTAESNSGSQFVNQRVTSYPNVAESRSVLAPVIEELELGGPFTALRASVDATNPPDTSLIMITVTDDDPVWASVVANAVATRFTEVVEDLEKPRNGSSPVSLTLTDQAPVPSNPVFPEPDVLLPLGLVAGLAVGLAAAIVRSRRDTRLYGEADVRSAWGNDADELTVYSGPTRRRRRGGLSPRPSTMLARRIEPMAARRPVRLVAAPVSPDTEPAARALVREVDRQLTAWDVPVSGAAAATGRAVADGPGAVLSVATPLAPLPEWRRIAREHDGIVLVAQAGLTDREDLREIRSVLDAAQAEVFALVLVPRRRGRKGQSEAQPRPTAPRARPPVPGRESVGVSR